MAFTAGQLVDDVLGRVRNVGTRDVVRSMLTHLQRLVNARLGLVVIEESFTTNPEQIIYQVSAASSAVDVIRILGVKQAERDLKMMRWQEFGYVDRQWLRTTASEPACFSLIGRDLLVLWPGTFTAINLTLVHAVLTDPLTDDGVAIQLPDDYVPLLVDLAEMMLLLKGRVFGPIPKILERVSPPLTMTA